MNYKTNWVLLALVLLTACRDESDGGNGKTNVISLDLEGTWITSCYLDGVNKYTIEEMIFSGNAVDANFKFWSNASCSGNPASSGSAFGTFTLGETITPVSGNEAVQIDLDLDFNGSKIVLQDIISQNDNAFNLGVANGGNGRPTELDFNITYLRQQEVLVSYVASMP